MTVSEHLRGSGPAWNGWTITSPTEAHRELEGVELALNHSEYYGKGDFQLTFAYPFTTSLTSTALQQRFHAAVWLARAALPELGLDTVGAAHPSSSKASSETRERRVRLDRAHFTAIESVEEAQVWLQDTAHIVQNARSFHEVCNYTSNQPIEPRGKQFRVYLVPQPEEGLAALILNVSHVLNGHRLLYQAQTILDNLFHPLLELHHIEGTSDIAMQSRSLVELVFQPEELKAALPRLPQSLFLAYKKKFKPEAEQIRLGTEKVAERMQNETKPTIGILTMSPLDPSLGNSSSMVNVRHVFTKSEAAGLRKTCRRNNASIPAFVYAAIVKSIDHSNGASKSSQDVLQAKGANLTFPGHASRWMPEATHTSAVPPVNIAVVPASVYMTPEELREQGNSMKDPIRDTFRLAKIIRQKQDTYLNSPDILACIDQIGKGVAQSIIAAQETLNSKTLDTHQTLSTPTLTSQGYLDIAPEYPLRNHTATQSTRTHTSSSDWLKLDDLVEYGRTTGASVCFALYTCFDGKLRLMVHFDERQFDAKQVRGVFDRACEVIHQGSLQEVQGHL